mgnify:CR=1 FL=1
MPENNKYGQDLSNYRIEMAEERLQSAKILLKEGMYKDSIGRSYYAIFTATRGLLALEGVDYSKHSGVISHFQKEYIKTGKIEVEYSKLLSKAFNIRNSCDYADYFLASKDDATKQCESAERFIKRIKEYIHNN